MMNGDVVSCDNKRETCRLYYAKCDTQALPTVATMQQTGNKHTWTDDDSKSCNNDVNTEKAGDASKSRLRSNQKRCAAKNINL